MAKHRVLTWMVLAAVVGLAHGQDFAVTDGGAAGPSVAQTVTVSVPPRYGLHVAPAVWHLDLGALDEDDACYMVPIGTVRPLKFTGWVTGFMNDSFVSFVPTSNYPATVDANEDGFIDIGAQGQYLKGTLACFARKIVQIHVNLPSWQFEVKFSASAAGFGTYFLVEAIGAMLKDQIKTSATADRYAFDYLQPTSGWFDFELFEGFWFDGTETPGTYDIVLTFTLMPPLTPP